MANKKVLNKNKPVSISLPSEQVTFIETHPKFNLSKFVQLALGEHINLERYVEKIQEEVKLNVREATIE
jgi:hypothetical protein